MSITLLGECISWVWIALCVWNVCIRINVKMNPAKYDPEMLTICEGAVFNTPAFISLLLCVLYVVWYKWGFTL